MKILVAYASKHGSTKEIAEAVAQEISAQDMHVDIQEVAAIENLTDYNAVVLGSAIYAGSWLPAAQHFAEQHRNTLRQRPLWVFSSGPIGEGDPKPHHKPEELVTSLGDTPVRDHEIFAGKLDIENLGFAERMITRALRAPTGDFRDWNAIRGWAQGIAEELKREYATPQ